MEFKGTKGKWEVRDENKADITTKKHGLLATTFGGFGGYTGLFDVISKEEQKNNAKLIAAAPEMFEMLQFISLNLPSIKNKELINDIEQLLTKITK